MKQQKRISKQIDKKTTKQVRIDSGLHKEAKKMAAKRSTTIRALIEEGLAEVLTSN